MADEVAGMSSVVGGTTGGLGTGGGLAAAVQAAPATTASATTTTPAATTHVRKPRATKPRANGSAAAATVDDNHRTITITLPKDVLAWYEQQAAAAPFEPSVQKFVAWELREFAKARQQAAAANSTLQKSQ